MLQYPRLDWMFPFPNFWTVIIHVRNGSINGKCMKHYKFGYGKNQDPENQTFNGDYMVRNARMNGMYLSFEAVTVTSRVHWIGKYYQLKLYCFSYKNSTFYGSTFLLKLSQWAAQSLILRNWQTSNTVHRCGVTGWSWPSVSSPAHSTSASPGITRGMLWATWNYHTKSIYHRDVVRDVVGHLKVSNQ